MSANGTTARYATRDWRELSNLINTVQAQAPLFGAIGHERERE
jgi:hypothetical protein